MGIRGTATLLIALVAAVVCRANGGDGANGAFKHGGSDQRRVENVRTSVSPFLRVKHFSVSPFLRVKDFSVVSAASVVSPANGTIRGRVEVRQPSAGTASRPSVADLGMSATHGPADRRSVVYLDPAPRAAFDVREEPRARMDQRDEMFVPHVLAIVAGTTVDFPNNDQTYHNVFSLSKTKSFDLGRYAVGRSKAVRFDRPGIVRVFCDIHSHMSAFILVFSHRYFSVVDREGRYRLENVPPGAYTVVAWNESAPLESRQAVLTEAGGDVEINFALGRR